MKEPRLVIKSSCDLEGIIDGDGDYSETEIEIKKTDEHWICSDCGKPIKVIY